MTTPGAHGAPYFIPELICEGIARNVLNKCDLVVPLGSTTAPTFLIYRNEWLSYCKPLPYYNIEMLSVFMIAELK